jgi:recombination protein RecA
MKEVKIKIGELFDAISDYEKHKFENNLELYQNTKLQVKDENNNWIGIKALIKKEDRIRKLKFSNGETLRCADKHLISFNKKDCSFANSLNIGDTIQLADDNLIYVESNEKEEMESVYDVSVDSETHLYQTSNKMIHHNTTLAMNFVKQVQLRGGIAAMVDAEHAFDPRWAKFNGINVNELLISQPDNGEEALEITESLIESGQVGIIVVDSVAALVPKAELEKDMGESSMGLHARLMSQACRKLTGVVSKSGTILIFLNQMRDKIGVSFGDPRTTTGGNALKYYASLRFEIARQETLKKGEDAYGVKTRVKIVKNKVASPFTKCTFDLLFKGGYDYEGSVVEEAVKYEFIQKGGAWFTYKGEKFQGLNGIKEHLRTNPQLIQELRELILTKVVNEGLSDEEIVLEEEPKKRVRKEEDLVIEEKIESEPEIISDQAEET